MTVLRDYQARAIADLRAHVAAGTRRVLVVAPTGAGKGTLAAHLVAASNALGRTAVFVAHRAELVEDLSERVTRLGVPHGVMLPGHPRRPDLPVQVASVQTLCRRAPPPADLLVLDEAHHASAASWATLVASYPQAVVVGLTATPCRLNGAPLGDVFGAMVVVSSPSELTEQGHLVPVTGWAFDSPDLRAVQTRAGDYAQAGLSMVMGGTKLVGNVVEQWLAHARSLRTVLFAVNCDHSRNLAEQFCAAGVPAEHVDGSSERGARQATFARFRSGDTQVLCNVQLATEGFDLPEIACVVLARPTLSLSLALQMIGRGRRPVPCPQCRAIPHWSKTHCACGEPTVKRVLRLHDHAGVVSRHGLPDAEREWSLTDSLRSSKKAAPVPLATCRSCFAIYPPARVCPVCGVAPVAKARTIETLEGQAVPLDQVQPLFSQTLMAQAYRGWACEGAEKGHKPGWAKVQFYRRFHRWPRKSEMVLAAAPVPQESPEPAAVLS